MTATRRKRHPSSLSAMMPRRALLQAGAALALGSAALMLLPAGAAQAEDLRIGLSADVTSMDPQWNNAAKRLREGIPVGAGLLNQVRQIAQACAAPWLLD